MTVGTKVLVVDDEQVVLDSVRKHLKREGYDIQTVLSGDEAIGILDRYPKKQHDDRRP